jgi:replication factor A2
MQGGSPFSATGSPGGMRVSGRVLVIGSEVNQTKRSETSHSLRPVTIAQLMKATQPHADAEWTIEGSEIGQVSKVTLT